ncbi:hypothetical protein [Rhodocyclus tenuis]|uniref:hypothetical protein n=1 Tax=Rhodocyclus tenuis TaxID=1066 RepID=UPI00190442EF|nr:hypothetical protein [Rhodocyclus tenuis]MBK1681766.1 hypothetical protein [Rhodocyclus tenuis]
MPSLPSLILEILAERAGLTDREIATALRGSTSPQQPVNIACRNLASKGRINRVRRADGLIGNFLSITDQPQPTPAAVAPAATDHPAEGLHEEEIKRILHDWLVDQGWQVEVAWGKAHGADIQATRGEELWIIEVKGIGSLAPMRVNYFVAILGETLQRMQHSCAKYSIALPNVQQFRRLWSRLPPLAKERTQISALFVALGGTIHHED